MARLTQEFVEALSDPHVKWMYLCRLHFDSGVLAFTSLARNYVYDGVTYQGFGTLGSVSQLSENSNLDPATYKIQLAGINTATLQAVLNEPYLGRKAICYLGALDENDKLICDPAIYFEGSMDQPTCEHSATGYIEVVIKDESADWARPVIERYTDQDQQARYPGDKGFEFVTSIPGKEIVWPASSFFD